MNTKDFLYQVNCELFTEGDEVMSVALAREPYDSEAREVFNKGHRMAGYANSLWSLIRLHQSFERSYWVLRELVK